MAGVRHQERQRVIDTRRIFMRDTGLHGAVGAYANKQGIIITLQLRQRDIASHFAVEFEPDPHRGKYLSAPREQGFIQLEGGNAKRQQSADFRMAVIHRHAHAAAHQYVGARQPCRARANNGHPLVHREDAAHVRRPAHRQRLV